MEESEEVARGASMLRVSLAAALIVGAALRADEPKAPTLRDYLPALLEKTQLDSAREYATTLGSLFKLAESLGDAGLIPAAQARQVEREQLQSRIDAQQRERDYTEVQDQFQRRFNAKAERLRELEDSAILPLQRHVGKFDEVFRGLDGLAKEFSKYDDPDGSQKLRAAMSRIVKSASMFEETRFRSQFARRWVALQKQTDREMAQFLHDKAEDRRKLAADKADVEEKGKSLSEESRRRLLSVELDMELARFEAALRRYEGEPWKDRQDAAARHADAFRAVGNAFGAVLLRGCGERLEQLRSGWPEIPALTVDKVDLLSSDREQAEQAVAAALKSPETATAVKAKLRKLRGLVETCRISQRLIELSLVQRQDDLDGLRSAAVAGGAAFTDANSPVTQLLATEKAVAREKSQLYRVWIEIQIARLELEADLGAGQ